MDLQHFHETTAKNLFDLLQFLKCPICLDIIENVRELPCRHVFCKNCIDFYAEDKGKVVCPLCKKEVPKRYFYSRDVGFDSICSFTKSLFNGLKEHNVDDSRLFGPVYALKEHGNANKCAYMKQKSSEDNDDVIPCTVKHKENKKPKKINQRLHARRKPLNIKSAVQKKVNIPIKKVEIPNVSKNLAASSNDLKKQLNPIIQKKHVINTPMPQLISNKSKILQWLHDTRNNFERFSQTQNNISQKESKLDVDMPSVSQRAQKRSNENLINENSDENKDVYFKGRRARSVEHLNNKETKFLKRHSLECSTPSNFKQYQNSNDVESIENQLIIHLMEDEVLDAIDKNISDKKYTSHKRMKSSKTYGDSESKIKLAENEFLDQLDKDCDNGKIKTQNNNKRTKINKDSKSSWKSISHFKKSIGKSKGPRKLNISMEASQKHSKRNIQAEIKGNNESNIAVEGKTVDFQKMEDYLSKVIPEMIKNNIPSSSHEVAEADQEKNLERSKVFEDRPINIQDLSSLQKHFEVDQCSDKSGSDIYIYHTQPLSKDMNSTINKIESAFEFAKKLEILLFSDKLEPTLNKSTITSIFQIIKNIYDNLQNNETVKHVIDSSQTFDSRKTEKIFDEKQIQTDIFSLDGFNITPTAAFKSLSYENKGTQTDLICVSCVHSKNLPGTDEKIILPANTLNTSSVKNKSGEKNLSLKYIEVEPGQYKNLEQCNLSKENKSSFQQNELIDSVINNAMDCEEIVEPCDLKLETKVLNFEKKVLNNSKITSSMKSNQSINPVKNSFNSNYEKSITSKEKSISDSSVSLNSNEHPVDSEMKPIKNQSQNDNFKNKFGMQTGAEENLNMKNSDINSTPDSVIMYSLAPSKSKVNRQLMFEKAIKDRTELKETLKRVHTENSNLESENGVIENLIYNKFLQDDLSIVFESETPYTNIQTQLTKNSNKRSSADNEEKKLCSNLIPTKNQTEAQHTQTDALLNYCDKLIAKANDQILSTDNQLNAQNFPLSLQNNNKPSAFQKSQKLDVIKDKEEDIQDKVNIVKTQDMLSHYDELIAKANRHIVINEEETKLERKTAGITYGSSQIPTTSKVLSEFEKEFQLYNLEEEILSENSLDACNISTKKIVKEVSIESPVDDDFFYQNLDKLNSVVEKANENKNKSLENKYSESLFESYKDINKIEKSKRETENESNGIIQINQLDTLLDNEDSSSRCTTKRRNSDIDNERNAKKIKILQNLQLDTERKIEEKKPGNFSSSEDEIFSDVDVIETTPQKDKHSNYLERLSFSQALNRSTKKSSKIMEDDSIRPITIDIVVPPPPGFGDEEDILKHKSSELVTLTLRASENIIPNSLSPEKEPMLRKRQLKSSNSSVKTENDCPDVPNYFQQFTQMSPICEDKTNLNVMEVVHQSKFSPLTILPRAPSAASPLTSTPKQKSILKYVTQNSKLTQNKNTDALSQISNSARPKPCIAYTRLDKIEVAAVRSLCSKELATCEDKFGMRVTHMIVTTDKQNRIKDHTIKYIAAIAAGIWVLNFNWIQECLTQNKIVDEELYEVIDVSGVPSPRISRISRLTNPLFKGYKFYVVGPFIKTSVQELETVIQLLSGNVVHSINDLLNRENHICVIIADESESEYLDKYQRWFDTHKLITVDLNWLCFSISRYKALSFKPHILVEVDYIYGLNYPQELLDDVPYSCTQQNTFD